MSIFDVDQQGAQRLADQAQADLVPYDDVQPGFFDDFGSAVGQGVLRGGVKLARAAGLALYGAGSLPVRAAGLDESDQFLDFTDRYFSGLDSLTTRAIDFWTPDARDVGTAGRVLGGLAEIAAPLVIGQGNPALLMASTGLNSATDLVRQGVDANTATAVGLVDTATVGVGFRLPFLGSTFLTKAGSGAAGNLALGVTATAADRAVLESQDYDEIAKQFDPLDAEARTLDLLTGVAFAGVAQLQGSARATRSRDARDSALAGLNAYHFEIEAAPGRPADQSSLIQHQSALEQAIRDLNVDEPVNVDGTRVTESNFRDPPARSAALPDDARAVLEELGIRDVTPEPARDTETPVVRDETPLAAADEALPRDIGPLTDAAIDPATDAIPGARSAAPNSGETVRAPANDPAPARPAEPVATDDIDVQAAQRAVETSDIEIPTGERDADDNQVLTSGRDALEQARQEVERASVEAKGYEAAVACLLSFGE